MEKTKTTEEPEFVSMGVATPTSGFDTIKRAETRVADTDTYKGRVLKMPEDEMVRLKICLMLCSLHSKHSGTKSFFRVFHAQIRARQKKIPCLPHEPPASLIFILSVPFVRRQNADKALRRGTLAMQFTCSDFH